jgi:PAS domain-containing protein
MAHGPSLAVRRNEVLEYDQQRVEAGVSNESEVGGQELTTADHRAPAAEMLALDNAPVGAMPGTAAQAIRHAQLKPSPKRAPSSDSSDFLPEAPPSQPVPQPWNSPAKGNTGRRMLHAAQSAGMATRRWLADNSVGSPRLPEQWRNPALGYAAAALLEVLATLLTLLLIRVNPGLAVRNVLPFLVVVVVAFAWGTGPSLLATLLGATLLYYALLPPYFSFAWTGANAISMLVFLLVALAFSYGTSRVERARRTAAALASELQATFDAMTDGVVVYDAQGYITHVNDAGREIYGEASATERLSLTPGERAANDAIYDRHGQPFTPERRRGMRAWRRPHILFHAAASRR